MLVNINSSIIIQFSNNSNSSDKPPKKQVNDKNYTWSDVIAMPSQYHYTVYSNSPKLQFAALIFTIG